MKPDFGTVGKIPPWWSCSSLRGFRPGVLQLVVHYVDDVGLAQESAGEGGRA